ncbi:J domain-containing protein [Sphingomonas sp. MMSM20]|uniref:J domain-containing protein n=1 Tax=Sphingomonas lycopersici TaxID=2951807 RepID=UPI002237AE93|nr:J domain-containing protein [Sphingomonas lycopersici]MCW6531099.1 J domain-containing protein [Sphingomonas lycopersici]
MAKFVLALLVAYAGWRLWKDAFGARPKPRRAVPVEAAERRAARSLLGVARDADDEAIRAAHRRLMAEAHPDRGGSAERARALNAARDLLVDR